MGEKVFKTSIRGGRWHKFRLKIESTTKIEQKINLKPNPAQPGNVMFTDGLQPHLHFFQTIQHDLLMRTMLWLTWWLWLVFARAEANNLHAPFSPPDTCPNFNLPAPLADSCHLAPFFCGNYLGFYCSTLAELTNDTFPGMDSLRLQHGGFLRFSPCDPDVAFVFSAGQCDSFPGGMWLTIIRGDCDSIVQYSRQSVAKGSTDTLHFPGLSPGTVYYLAVSSYGSGACDFSLQAVEGIGTGVPDLNQPCVCTDAKILGPDTLCAPALITCTYSPPDCTIPVDSTAGGNGSYCRPPGGFCAPLTETVEFIWHIPPYLKFVGDSTGPVVQLTTDSIYFNKDTLLQDSVWLEIRYTASSDPLDSLTFCICDQGCQFKILAKPITVIFNIRNVKGFLNCSVDSFQVDSVVYRAPGTYYQYGPACLTVIVEVEFQKDTMPEGVLGTLTCADTCLNLHNMNICAPGEYTAEDSCYVYLFTVAADTLPPAISAVMETCLPGNEQYQVQFQIDGQGPFSVNSGALSGNTYLSPPINNLEAYNYVVEDAKGCRTPLSGSYDCGPALIYMPNVISPMSNVEVNRFFTISAAEGRESIRNIETLRIYNRWGSCIWERSDLPPGIPEKGWDGTNQNRHPVPTDTYLFWAMLQLESGERRQVSGDITVIK